MAKKRVHLPEEVITEILLRLPVKSVLRFKCVCKLWLSLISDPNFATSHFQLSASPTHRIVFIEYYATPQTLSIDFHASLDDDSASSLSLDPEIGGSCRGFLFLHSYTVFYLWNPSTGVHKQIPASPITIASNSNDNTFKLLYGFGYDMSTDDYMVVLGSYEYDDDYEPVFNSIDLEIFSLRANEWEQIEFDSHLPYRNATTEDGPRVGSFLNGSIHWLVHNRETKKNVITAFDLKETTMSEIALPDAFHVFYTYPMEYDLLVRGGLIGAWIVDMDMETVQLWVMQEYSVHSSWTKTLVFSLNYIWHFAFTPICSTNSGDIVGSDGLGGFAKFNDKGQLLEHHSYYRNDQFSARFQMAVCAESLLSLPSGGIEQD